MSFNEYNLLQSRRTLTKTRILMNTNISYSIIRGIRNMILYL